MNETVTAGNWPWCVITSGCVVVDSRAIVAERHALAASCDGAPRAEPRAGAAASTVGIGASIAVAGVGVYSTGVVGAFASVCADGLRAARPRVEPRALADDALRLEVDVRELSDAAERADLEDHVVLVRLRVQRV